jgi:methylated-DNA-[protein]-cysteine S-methyltransferase
MNQQKDRGALTCALWHAPIGWLAAVAGGQGLLSVLSAMDRETLTAEMEQRYPGILPGREGAASAALKQLREYFSGSRRKFQLQLDFGTLPHFTIQVLKALEQIPFGETVTYGALAGRAGRPGAARAVGGVMAANPFPLVLPCHRVLGAGGKLTGYSGGGGLATKQWLLEFEKRLA